MVSSIGGSRRIYPHCLVCGTQRGDGHWTPSRPGGLGPFSLVRHGRRASSFALHHPSPFHSRATVRNLVRHPHHWPIQRPTVSAGGARPCGQTALGSWGAGPGEGKTNNNPDTTGDEMDGERKKVQALSASVPFLQFTSSHLIPSVSSPAQLVGYSRPGCIHCPAKSLRGVMDRGHGRGAFADNTSASVCSGSGSVTALVPSWPQQQPSAISHQPSCGFSPTRPCACAFATSSQRPPLAHHLGSSPSSCALRAAGHGGGGGGPGMEPFPPASRTLLAVYCVEFGCRRGGYDDESVCCVVRKWP